VPEAWCDRFCELLPAMIERARSGEHDVKLF